MTFNPGVYYLVGGGLNANAGAALTGTGVTFVNTEKKPLYSSIGSGSMAAQRSTSPLR